MPDVVLQNGTDEGYVDNPVVGQSDPFPTIPLHSYGIYRLAQTRMAALLGRALPFALTWNDAMYAYRGVYAKTPIMGLTRPSNLLFAYAPSKEIAYSKLETGTVQTTTGTDITGKTITFATSQMFDQARVQGATGVSTAPLAAGSLDNQVWLFRTHGEPAVAAAPIMYLRRTDANNWIRIFRQSATNLRIEKDVASVTTTEADITIPATEPFSDSTIAVRINGTVCQVWMNGTLYSTFTLSAGAQGLTGLLVGFDVSAVGRAAMGELEVWSTAEPRTY